LSVAAGSFELIGHEKRAGGFCSTGLRSSARPHRRSNRIKDFCCTCSGLLLADIVAKVPNCPVLIFPAVKKSDRRPPIDVAPITLPRSPARRVATMSCCPHPAEMSPMRPRAHSMLRSREQCTSSPGPDEQSRRSIIISACDALSLPYSQFPCACRVRRACCASERHPAAAYGNAMSCERSILPKWFARRSTP
jgi:hypothetical protein